MKRQLQSALDSIATNSKKLKTLTEQAKQTNQLQRGNTGGANIMSTQSSTMSTKKHTRRRQNMVADEPSFTNLELHCCRRLLFDHTPTKPPSAEPQCDVRGYNNSRDQQHTHNHPTKETLTQSLQTTLPPQEEEGGTKGDHKTN
jgi:hypothetical protein